MRITNSTPLNTDNVSNSAARPETTPSPAAGASSNSSASSAMALLAFSLVPSFELLNLDAALSQVPAIRQDVLAQTILKLASGDLDGASALDATARAILGG
jgi:hypothetical protein